VESSVRTQPTSRAEAAPAQELVARAQRGEDLSESLVAAAAHEPAAGLGVAAGGGPAGGLEQGLELRVGDLGGGVEGPGAPALADEGMHLK